MGETLRVRFAVVGHTEWIQFVRVPRVPRAGAILQASAAWEQPGGGGGVAVQQLTSLAGSAAFFTALGDDQFGHRSESELEAKGVRVHAAWREPPHRRAVTFTDDDHERTITLLSPKLTPRGDDPLPWADLDEVDAVYFTAREAGALREARRARVLVVTARELATAKEAGVYIDALIGSADDPAEQYARGALDPLPGVVIGTGGAQGGHWETADGAAGTYEAAPLPGPPVDAYGAGDCFAAGFTYALGRGVPLGDALALAARCGAYALTGPGVHIASHDEVEALARDRDGGV
jgi:ribokinase